MNVPEDASVRSRVTAALWSCCAAATIMDLLTKPLKRGKAEMANPPTI